MFDVRRPTTEPACPFCLKGPLLPSEQLCPHCRAQGLKVHVRCRVCSCALTKHDDYEHGVCESCSDRPEGKRLLAAAKAPPRPAAAVKAPAPPAPPAPAPAPRAFTPSDKSLIKHTASFMPTLDLLRILNDRMRADLGPDAPEYTLEQLQSEISATRQDAVATDWAGVRQVLQVARRCGVLEQITPQVIDDFATVFNLSSAQRMHLRDVIRSAKEGQ